MVEILFHSDWFGVNFLADLSNFGVSIKIGELRSLLFQIRSVGFAAKVVGRKGGERERVVYRSVKRLRGGGGSASSGDEGRCREGKGVLLVTGADRLVSGEACCVVVIVSVRSTVLDEGGVSVRRSQIRASQGNSGDLLTFLFSEPLSNWLVWALEQILSDRLDR